MVDYIQNKVLSVGAVFLCIVCTYWLYGFNADQWRVILLTIVCFGYAHFLVGFYYQLKGFARAEVPIARYASFLILTLISIGVAYLLFAVLGFVMSLFIGFLYFLLHGLLNEQTLILRQTGLSLPLLPLIALAIFIISLLTYSVPDKTFFFDAEMNFYPVSESIIDRYFSAVAIPVEQFTTIFWAGFCLAVCVVLVSWYRYRVPRFIGTVAALIGVMTIATMYFGAPPYIYMYLFVVGYHFMTWLLFYLKEFMNRGRREFSRFILINAGVVFSLLLLFWQESTAPTMVSDIVFDYRTFVVLTYIHISTSFMNDVWWKRLETAVVRHVMSRRGTDRL